MRKSIFLVTVLSSIILSAAAILHSISNSERILIWEETTVADFSKNELENLVITNNSGGEVRFPEPVQKTVADYQDNDVPRYLAYNSSGNYIHTWTRYGNIFVQKYISNGDSISPELQVNDVNGIAGKSTKFRCALLDNGYFCVVWENQDGRDHDMYGQLFSNSNVKIDSNFIINEITNYSNHIAVVWGNNSENNFWIYHSLIHNNDYKILIQKRDLNGLKLGQTFVLNQDNPTKNESYPTVLNDNAGNIIVAWVGNNTNISTYTDVYVRLYNSSGEPLGTAVKVNDEKTQTWNGQPDICKDKNGNLLLTWSDFRDNTSEYHPYTYSIYGQFLNFRLEKLGSNFRVNTPKFHSNLESDVDFIDNEFQISWKVYDVQYFFYVNRWKFLSFESGIMISSIIDTGPGGAEYHNIFWNQSLPANTSIGFKIRSTERRDALNSNFWYGPTDTSGFYDNSSGQKINELHAHQRFIQYQAVFQTEETGITPVLNSIFITFTPQDSITPSAPTGLEAIQGHSHISLSWTANQEEDVASYHIYRSLKSGYYDDNWKRKLPSTEIAFIDFSAITGTQYFYTISAVDSSRNESDLSEEVSAIPEGINIYVSAHGSVAGDGTKRNPLLTIGHGIEIAEYGDNIILMPGSYTESVDMKKGVSIIGSGAHETELIGTREDYIVKCSDDVVLKGLSLIRHSSFPRNAIFCENSSPAIMNNIIICYSGNQDVAIYCRNNASPSIIKNYISGFYSGVRCTDGSNLEIRNNIIDAFSQGIGGVMNCEFKIINNTIFVEDYTGIELIHWSKGIIKNNIIVGKDNTRAIGIRSDNSTIEASYNNVWNLYTNYVDVNTGTGSISADPLFVNPGGQNYTLQEISPCRDAGESSIEYNDTDGSINDMGAYGGPDPIDPNFTSRLVKSIRLSRLSGFPGDTVSAFVSVDEPAGIAKAEFLISFDPLILTFLQCLTTETTNNFNLRASLVETGIVKFILQNETAIDTGPDSILQIDFLVSSQVHSGDATQIVFENPGFYDKDLINIILRSITDGVFVVNQGSETGRFVYVDASKQIPGDGTRYRPFTTIQGAIDNSAFGDTIVVSAGTYAEKITMKDGIYLRGSGSKVTFIRPAWDEVGVEFKDIQKSEISGFTIKGPDHDPNEEPLISCSEASPKILNNRFESFMAPLDGLRCTNNSNPTIDGNAFMNMAIFVSESAPLIINNEITGGMTGAIFCYNQASPQIIGNKIYDSELSGYGIQLTSFSTGIIKNNHISRSHSGLGGIFLNGVENVVIQNNIFTDDTDDDFKWVGIEITNSTGIEIINNTMNTLWRGVNEENSVVTLYNNIIIGNKDFGLRFSESATHDYNNSWNTGDNYYQCDPDEHGISADPLFVNPEQGDYHLSSGSPCVDAGNPDLLYNDWDGTRNDMGAYGGSDADSLWIFCGGCIIKADTLETSTEETVTLNIDGTSIQGAAHFETILSFNPNVLNFIDARSTDLSKSFSLTKTRLSSNSVRIVMDGVQGIFKTEGTLLELIFDVNASKADVSPIHFESALLSDAAMKNINIVEIRDGLVKITGTAIENDNTILPLVNELFQCYPNPFNNSTTIKYKLAQTGSTELVIYNLLGQKVCTLVNSYKNSGTHFVKWNGNNDNGIVVSSGIYFYQIKTDTFSKTKKLLLVK